MRFPSTEALFALAFSTAKAETFTNPVIWQDLADNEVSRVGSTFFMTASTMHYSPGAPVLQSSDLVNWDYVGHSVPVLDWASKYDLVNGTNAYVEGIYASSLRYRESDGLWYFVACIQYTASYIYTSPSPSGPWTELTSIATCYYDAGLLFDPDDDTPYVAYGNTELSVAQLTSDCRSEVSHAVVYDTPSDIGALEGSRMYKKDGAFYIFVTQPATSQYILKAADTGAGPWGTYEIQPVVQSVTLAAVPAAGNPHQGSLVDTPDGQWYYMAFADMYPGGRCPVLAPVTWDAEGWPEVQLVNGTWGDYDYPVVSSSSSSSKGKEKRTVYTFDTLTDEWEWNHNPDTSAYALVDGELVLSTATVTDDIYAARNTLTHRIAGPVGTGTVQLDISGMAAGDRAGLAMFRDESAWIGVRKDSEGVSSLVMVSGAVLDNSSGDWATTATGSVVESVELGTDQTVVYLRATADIEPGASGVASFSYSLDGGPSFQGLGADFVMSTNWEFYLGYRYGIFNFATAALGGSVKVITFETT